MGATCRSDSCLVHRLETARRDATFWFVDAGGTPTQSSIGELVDLGRSIAAHLQDIGVTVGSSCALAGQPGVLTVASMIGVWLAGAAVTILPIDRGAQSVDEHARMLMARCAAADADVLILGNDVGHLVEQLSLDGDAGTVRLVDSQRVPRAAHPDTPPCDPERIALLQFTSGTTSASRVAQISHRALTTSVDSMTRHGALDTSDVFISWLPLYHDMGLVGFLVMPLLIGASAVVAPPTAFARMPLRWARWINEYGGTITAGPSSAYAVLERTLRRARDVEDLSSCRVALHGAEPISPDGVRRLVESASRHGLPSSSVLCAYGLAEATLGVTFPAVGSGMRTDTPADSGVVWREGHAMALHSELAMLGSPLDAVEVKIVDTATRQELDDRAVGSILVRGDVLMSGYRGGASTQPVDWVETGDLGYWIDGQLVVCGRTKDVVIVGGRNLNAEALEDCAARALNGHARGVCATSRPTPDGERLLIVLEGRASGAKEARDLVLAQLRTELGLVGAEILVVKPGALPRTSSGKIRRGAVRGMIEA